MLAGRRLDVVGTAATGVGARQRLCLPASRDGGRCRAGRARATKRFDVIGLSNLCVDVIQPVPELPAKHAELLDALTAQPPPQTSWEVGGNANFMIAAARMGMQVGSVGHVGSDVYGRYLEGVLQSEGIAATTRLMPPQLAGSGVDKTLLCFVLVDPAGQHAFCSRYDFGPWPLLSVDSLAPPVMHALASTAAVFTNGFVFDELPLGVVRQAVQAASSAGAAICFDPGPRAFTMREGSRRHALDTLLDLSDVVLMTEEEALQVTGHAEAQAAAEAILARPGAKTQWCVVKQGGAGALLATKGGEVHRAGAFDIEPVDTVGCGDSFAAAIVLGFARGHDVRGTLLLANAVGAATAMGRGAGTNVASAGAVLALLQEAAAGSGSSRSRSSSDSSSSSGRLRPSGRDVDAALSILHDSLASADADGSELDSRAPAAHAA